MIRGYGYLACAFHLTIIDHLSFGKQDQPQPGAATSVPVAPWHAVYSHDTVYASQLLLWCSSCSLEPPTMLATYKAPYICLLVELMGERYLQMLK